MTIDTFVSKVMSLLYNTLSRFVIAFLSRSKHLLVSWCVTICGDFGAQENSLSLFPFFLHLFKVMRLDAMILVLRMLTFKSALTIRCPKFWSFSISPSNEYSGLTSFRIDWLALLAVQETLKSLLQHHSSKAPILQPSAFFMA